MSWVCECCSTNNDEENKECFVCGAERPVVRVAPPPTTSSSTAPAAARTTPSEPTRAATPPVPPSRRCRSVSKSGVAAIIVVLSAFIIGQAFLYLFYAIAGRVLFLTAIIESFELYDFNTKLFLIITSALGAVSAAITAYVVYYLADFFEHCRAWLIAITFSLGVLVIPEIVCCWLPIFAIIFIRSRDSGGIKAAIGVFIAVTVAAIALTAWYANKISDTYTIMYLLERYNYLFN